ncbi:MAG: 16S rRNA (adenine(1518)-N(6)/adenine(1519)-N(6))-dimethyltransferase RsmA [Dehalococcoidia bacterium]
MLHQFHLHARKSLGQHFLIDPAVLEASVSAAGLSPDEEVIEVGPGLGFLTEELAKSARRVIAVEIDSRIVSYLKKRFAKSSNVLIRNADILRVDIAREVAGAKYKMVANLPYYTAAPVIRFFLEASEKPVRMVVMVQKEVAENMVAAPGRMGLLGVSVQLYGKPSIVCYVPAKSFYPVPKVASAIVAIDVYGQPAVKAEPDEFFRVVKAGFSAPRKQLRNSLAQGLCIEPTFATEVLQKAGIAPQRRAQTLTLEEWAELCESINREPRC